MSDIQQQAPASAGTGGGPQLDPQGLLGSLLGGLAGGFIGKHVGGSTGQTVGTWAGRALGTLIPFEAGPQAPQAAPAAPAAQGPSQVELQNFWDVIGKIAGGVQTGLNIGHQVGLFQAGPESSDEQPSQLEMQGFFDVIRKVAGGLQTGLNVAQKLGILSADQPSAAPAQRPQISEIEAQCFGRVINWLGKHRPQTPIVQQGAGAAPLSVGPQNAGTQPTQVELQSFWSVLGSIAKGVGTGLNIGHQIGLFEAGPASAPQPSQPSQVELQGFWDTLRKIAGGVQTGLNVARQFVPFDAGPQTPQTQPRGQGLSLVEAQALLQQALPTLQALAQAQAQSNGQAVH